MNTLDYEKQNNHSIRNASLFFAIILIGIYAPLFLLNQTYLINNPIPSEYLISESKSTIFGITIDYSMHGNYPDIKLASDMILNGELPFWNPYVGVGYPLFADTTHHVFSPLNLGFLLPEPFWDLPFLVILWTAGFTTFLFLRNLGLNFVGSITGGLFYMLSGCFTWYLPNPNPFVMFATPLILLTIDKTIQTRAPKHIFFLSLSFGLSILGGHLQSLILQFLLISCYLFYRLLSTFFISCELTQNFVSARNRIKNMGKPLIKVLLGLLGGFGLAAFYIFPVVEFFQNGILERDVSYGTIEYNPLSLLSAFVPYILGPLHTYWTTNTENISLFGYSGTLALFFSVIGLIISLKNKTHIHRFTPLFFLSISTLSLMRLANVPVISWIGQLPIFDVMYFGNYAGVLIPFGFAVSAGFGVHYVVKKNFSKKIILLSLFFSAIVISALSVPIIYELFLHHNFPSYISEIDAKNYVFFQLLQSFTFLGFAGIVSLILLKKHSIYFALIPLILLELSLYVPFGLHPVWIAYKFLLSVVLTMFLILISKFYSVTPDRKKKFITFNVITITLFFIGSLILSYYSPYGMPLGTDTFSDNPVSVFLNNNLDDQRFFSFEHTMGPDYSAAFQISSLGKLSSFNIADFYTFVPTFLDKDADPGRFGAPSWSAAYGPSNSIAKFLENKKYFDFLGVKYIVTKGYDFDTVSYGSLGNSGQFSLLSSTPNDFYQDFVSPIDSIESIGVVLGSTLFNENDQVVLTLDSIPFDDSYHRVQTITDVKNGQLNEFYFDIPIENALEKSFRFTLHHPQHSSENFVVIYHNLNSSDMNNVTYFEHGIKNESYFIPFTIKSLDKKYDVDFNFNDIYITKNPDAFPRAFFVHKITQVPSGQGQTFLLNNPQFDLRNEVILESPLPNNWKNFSSELILDSPTVNIINYGENTIEIQSVSDHKGVLVLTDVFYPGWTAKIDGTPTEILKADGLVRAILVPEGKHVIEFEYVPTSFTLGILISLIVFTVLLCACIVLQKLKIKV